MVDYQGEKFKKFLESKGISKVYAAEKLGINRVTLHRYFKSKDLERKTVANILTSFNVSEEEIFGDQKFSTPETKNISNPYKGNMEVSFLQEPAERYNKVVPIVKRIPIYDVDFSAGGSLSLVETRDNVYPVGHIEMPELNSCSQGILVKGDSMKGVIENGDYVGIKRLFDWNNYIEYGQMYAIVTDERRMVKYVRKGSNSDCFLIVSANENYDPFELPKNLIREVWAVIAVLPKIRILMD